MGQKVNPHGMRVGIIKDWDSRWYAGKKEFGDTLVEDYNIREYIKKNLYAAGIDRVEIERMAGRIRLHIHCAKPGMIVGQKGAKIDELRATLEKKFGKSISINLIEVKNMDLAAQLVAEKIADDLERRISFRRAMKGAMGRTMKSGAKGVKIKCAGRLGGAEIARSECYHEGTIPLQTIRADIDYGFAEANTTYGRIGVKVWIYKGEILKGDAARAAASKERRERRPDRDRRRRGGNDRSGDRRPPRRDGAPRQGNDRRPRYDRGQGQPRREGGTQNAAPKES